MENYCEEYSSCNNVLQSLLTKFNSNDHVVLPNETVEALIIIKEQAGKCGMAIYSTVCVYGLISDHSFYLEGKRNCTGSDDTPLPTELSANSNVTAGIIAAIAMSMIVVIAMIGMIVLILFYFRKTKQLKVLDNVSQ